MRALTLVLTVALAALGGSAASGTAAAPSLNTALGNALRSQGIAPTRTAAIVLDVRTGTPVYAFNSTASLLPASLEKLAVSYTALRVLGPRFRFRTELVGVGARTGRVWHGTLGLVGYGDPTLTPADLNRIARRFADTGVPGTVLEDNDIAGEVSTVRATNIHQHAVMPCHRNDLHIRDNR